MISKKLPDELGRQHTELRDIAQGISVLEVPEVPFDPAGRVFVALSLLLARPAIDASGPVRPASHCG